MRTTETAVREIMQTALDSTQIVAFILDADLWITEELAGKIAPNGRALSDERLEIIERWLVCALVRVRDLGLKSASVRDVSESYQVDADVTNYLLYAAGMDPTDTVRRAFLDVKNSTGFLVKARVGRGFKADDTCR